jgi:hypothetical protein
MKFDKQTLAAFGLGIYFALTVLWFGYSEYRIRKIESVTRSVLQGHLSVRDYVLKHHPIRPAQSEPLQQGDAVSSKPAPGRSESE